MCCFKSTVQRQHTNFLAEKQNKKAGILFLKTIKWKIEKYCDFILFFLR